MNKFAKFGPAGNDESFYEHFKATADAPKWISEMGLTAFEYQCGRGINISELTARKIGEQAALYGISMSLHSPYFINLSSDEPDRIAKNNNYIINSAKTVGYLGGNRIVVHCGGLGKRERSVAMQNTKLCISSALSALDEQNLGDITLCIETMGRINVLGDLDEVLEICEADERLLPCIDFGHLNARTHGGLSEKSDFTHIFDEMERRLGRGRASLFHAHFSKIEYSAGGEVKHLTFSDEMYGPNFEHIAEITAVRGYTPTFICESSGTQARDACTMQNMYEGFLKI